MLKPGDRAPDFKLVGDDDKTHTLKEFAGKHLVLYFYPRNATPGCTVEACEFRASRAAIGKKDAVIVGVSPDTVASHQKWQAKEKLGFLLLSDPDHKAASAFGTWGEKTLYGRKFMGIIRSTFVVDPAGKIQRAQYKVSPKGHAAEILAELGGVIAPKNASVKAKAKA
jgi:peroxiredoxin Q/BCP